MLSPALSESRPVRMATLSLCVGILLGSLLGPGAAFAKPADAPAAQTALSVSPSSGPAGMTLTVTGSGHTPGGHPGTHLWSDTSKMTFTIPGSAAPMPPTISLGWLAGLLAYSVPGGRRVRGRARRRG